MKVKWNEQVKQNYKNKMNEIKQDEDKLKEFREQNKIKQANYIKKLKDDPVKYENYIKKQAENKKRFKEKQNLTEEQKQQNRIKQNAYMNEYNKKKREKINNNLNIENKNIENENKIL